MLNWDLLGTIALVHLVALASPGPDFAIMLKVSREQTRRVALMTALGIALAILLHTLASLTGLSILIHTTSWLFIAVQAIGALYLGYMGIGALLAVKQHITVRLSTKAQVPLEANVAISAGVTTDEADEADEATDANQSTDANVANKPSTDPHKLNAPPSTRPNSRSDTGPDARANKRLSTVAGFKLGLYTNLLNPKALVFFLTLFSAMVGPDVEFETRSALLLLMFTLSFCWFGLLALVLTGDNARQLMARIGPAIDLLVGILFVGVSIAILHGLLLGLSLD